jgi:hypothetical protein
MKELLIGGALLHIILHALFHVVIGGCCVCVLHKAKKNWKMKKANYTDILEVNPNELRKRAWIKGFPLCIFGAIVYGILRLFRCKPKKYHGITCFEIGKTWGGVTFGWFFICGKDVSNCTKDHEVGHIIQNARVGGIQMVIYTIGSAFRYWKHMIFGSKVDYDAWWFEGQATKLGYEYIDKIKAETINKEG